MPDKHVWQANAWHPGHRLQLVVDLRQNTQTSEPASCLFQSGVRIVQFWVADGCELIEMERPCAK